MEDSKATPEKLSDVAIRIAKLVSALPRENQARLLHFLEMKLELEAHADLIEPKPAASQESRQTA
jgi:hypothetical protein